MRHICEAVIAVYAQLGACSSYIWTACPCSKNLLRVCFIAVVIGKKDSCSQAPAQLSVAGNTYQCHKVLGPPLDWAPSPGPNLLVKWDPHHEIGPPPPPFGVGFTLHQHVSMPISMLHGRGQEGNLIYR